MDPQSPATPPQERVQSVVDRMDEERLRALAEQKVTMEAEVL